MLSAQNCAVLFDLDGVIVDTKEAHRAAFLRLGEEVGYTMSDEQYRHAFGRRNEEIFPYLYGHPLPPQRVAELAERKEATFRDLIRGNVHALPGVPALIPALHAAGFHLAIGSSTPRANIDFILAALNLAHYFQVIISAEDVTKGKPDPEVFVAGATRLGIPPARCVVVEDAVAGVEAALHGGMKALAVTTNHPRKALARATRVVDSLGEVGPGDFLVMVKK